MAQVQSLPREQILQVVWHGQHSERKRERKEKKGREEGRKERNREERRKAERREDGRKKESFLQTIALIAPVLGTV